LGLSVWADIGCGLRFTIKQFDQFLLKLFRTFGIGVTDLNRESSPVLTMAEVEIRIFKRWNDILLFGQNTPAYQEQGEQVREFAFFWLFTQSFQCVQEYLGWRKGEFAGRFRWHLARPPSDRTFGWSVPMLFTEVQPDQFTPLLKQDGVVPLVRFKRAIFLVASSSASLDRVFLHALACRKTRPKKQYELGASFAPNRVEKSWPGGLKLTGRARLLPS